MQPFFLILPVFLYLRSARTAQKYPKMHNTIVLSDPNLFATIQHVKRIKFFVEPGRNSYGDHNRHLAKADCTLVIECTEKSSPEPDKKCPVGFSLNLWLFCSSGPKNKVKTPQKRTFFVRVKRRKTVYAFAVKMQGRVTFYVRVFFG